MNRFHLIVGVVTVGVFLGTGVYLRMGFPELHAENESIRFLFRANHVYVLFSGLLNALAGLALPFTRTGWRKKFQQAGSLFLLASAPVFLVAFIVEPIEASPTRPITVAGASAALAGVTLHFLASRRAKT